MLLVTAHPDDESPLAAGTAHAIVGSGGEVRLLCATLGERGRAYVAEGLATEELKRVRFTELHTAALVIGMTSVEVLDLGDGQVAEHIDSFVEHIGSVLKGYKPDFVMSFGLDGYTGHVDHVATHHAAARAAQLNNVSFAAFALPPEPWRTQCLAVLQKKRKFGTYHNHEEFALPTACVQVDGVAKRAAIHSHQSQLAGLDPEVIFPVEFAEHTLTHEYFVL